MVRQRSSALRAFEVLGTGSGVCVAMEQLVRAITVSLLVSFLVWQPASPRLTAVVADAPLLSAAAGGAALARSTGCTRTQKRDGGLGRALVPPDRQGLQGHPHARSAALCAGRALSRLTHALLTLTLLRAFPLSYREADGSVAPGQTLLDHPLQVRDDALHGEQGARRLRLSGASVCRLGE